jgi:hypothetical protein
VSGVRRFLFHPVDGAGLAAFRILFGLLLCAGMCRFLFSGWIPRFYGEPQFFFHYWGFSWVRPAPIPVMYGVYGVLALLALLIAVGLFYRVSVLLFTLGFTYTELIDVTNYLNHYYLVSLIGLCLLVSPLHRTWSLDAVRRPELRADYLPAWALYLLRFQVGIVYVFAGLAKLQPDWLLHAQPLNLWFAARTETPIIGAWLDRVWVAYVASWLAAFYDLTVVFWLSWRRTQRIAYAAVIAFHTGTAVFFNIGLFPYLMTVAALLFFPPSWPRQLLRLRSSAPAPAVLSASPHWRIGASLAAAYAVLQVAMPLRHFAYPGDVLWNEDGMRWAWKVMVREKHGSVTYFVRMPATGVEVQVAPQNYLTYAQEREMSAQPDLILQLAHHIADDFAAAGYGQVEVRAQALVSLNGRPAVDMIDPQRDLASIPQDLSPSDWVLPSPTSAPILVGDHPGMARR